MDFENLSVSVLSDLPDRIVHNNHHRIDVVNIEVLVVMKALCGGYVPRYRFTIIHHAYHELHDDSIQSIVLYLVSCKIYCTIYCIGHITASGVLADQALERRRDFFEKICQIKK